MIYHIMSNHRSYHIIYHIIYQNEQRMQKTAFKFNTPGTEPAL